VGDFVPATRHEPADLDLAAFLPVNNARGFGASRVLPNALTSTLTRVGRAHAADDNVLRALGADHGATMRALAYREKVLAKAAEMWVVKDVKGALAEILGAGKLDVAVAYDFVREFQLDKGALLPATAVGMVDILLLLLTTPSDGAVALAAASWSSLVAAFGGYMKTMLEASAPSSIDVSFDERVANCAALLKAFESFRARAKSSALTPARANMLAVTEAVRAYEVWRTTLPLPAVAAAARAAAADK